MTHTLFGSRGSGSAAIEIALRLCAIPYREVRASTWEADSAQEELRKLNPLGQIPTLVMPDGSVMTESAAILIHLGLSHPESGLLSAEPNARAQTIRGLVFIAANCYSAISIIDYPERWTTATDKPSRDAVEQGSRDRLHRHWEQFADIFPATPHLSGSHLGALDILAAVVSRWSGARAHLAQHRPALTEALGRIEAHPVVAEVSGKHWKP